jgi:hypothetical protein
MKRPPQAVSCPACLHFVEYNALDGMPKGAGTCRLNPPQVVVIHAAQGANIMNAFPSVGADTWCSAYADDADTEPILTQ